MTDYQKESVYVYYDLYMNPMAGRCENVQLVKRFPSIEAAQKFYEGELVESYQDPGADSWGYKRYNKSFRKGGPLEWYNPLYGEWWKYRNYGAGLIRRFSEQHPDSLDL